MDKDSCCVMQLGGLTAEALHSAVVINTTETLRNEEESLNAYLRKKA